MDIKAQVEFIQDEIRGAWRFRWFAIGAAWIIAVVGWVGLGLMPNTYQASAKVFVDTSTAIKPLLQGLAIDTDAQSQVDLVRLALLSRPQLEKVTDSMGLTTASMTPRQREGRIDALVKQLGVTAEARRESERTYTITYKDTDRARSLELVQHLLDTFVNDVLGGNRVNQATAQQFLTAQIADYEARLTAAEAKLADFKKRNLGMVPGERGDYFSRMQAEENARNEVQARLNVAVSKRSVLESQLRGEVAYLPSKDPATTSGGSLGNSGGGTAARLQEAEARLQELLLRFTDKHPDVIAARATISDLRERQQRELAALRAGNLDGAGSTAGNANPVFQQIQSALNGSDVDIAALRREIVDRDQRIAELHKLADTAPEVEAEYARLNRDYGITKAQYQSLVERLEKAKLTEEAEEVGVVKFEVIEPPRATLEPVSPNRPLMAVAVLVLACAAGVSLAYARHVTKPVFFSPRQLTEAVGLPILGTVMFVRPEVWRGEHAASNRNLTLAVSALVGVFVLVLFTQNALSGWLLRVMA